MKYTKVIVTFGFSVSCLPYTIKYVRKATLSANFKNSNIFIFCKYIHNMHYIRLTTDHKPHVRMRGFWLTGMTQKKAPDDILT